MLTFSMILIIKIIEKKNITLKNKELNNKSIQIIIRINSSNNLKFIGLFEINLNSVESLCTSSKMILDYK